jgi:hypothetical protein
MGALAKYQMVEMQDDLHAITATGMGWRKKPAFGRLHFMQVDRLL